jgi:hypothetical protein
MKYTVSCKKRQQHISKQDYEITIEQDIYFPNYEKLKPFVETFIPYNQIIILAKHLCMSNLDFYI